ncbi:hypothetical protein Tsubulata_019005 [Turnera subulata]|uniref:Uncharacterized protein n=1 Tax=Turnera subulata TaxID=218843 RepID=A0A9Q0JR20_9ROSI|nr:hypothetical protein Tsubulata_019005 [Turnera subulata]
MRGDESLLSWLGVVGGARLSEASTRVDESATRGAPSRGRRRTRAVALAGGGAARGDVDGVTATNYESITSLPPSSLRQDFQGPVQRGPHLPLLPPAQLRRRILPLPRRLPPRPEGLRFWAQRHRGPGAARRDAPHPLRHPGLRGARDPPLATAAAAANNHTHSRTHRIHPQKPTSSQIAANSGKEKRGRDKERQAQVNLGSSATSHHNTQPDATNNSTSNPRQHSHQPKQPPETKQETRLKTIGLGETRKERGGVGFG